MRARLFSIQLMAKREYSEEVKAQVMAALLDGQSIRAVARQTGVPKSTVEAWGKLGSDVVPSVRDILDAKKERIHELLVDLLIAKLESQIAQTQHAGDKVWLRDQDASAFAMLIGVNDDKLMRLLEKFDGAESKPDPS